MWPNKECNHSLHPIRWWIVAYLIPIVLPVIAFFLYTCGYVSSAQAQSATIPNLTLDSSPAPTDQLIVHKSGETRAKKTTRGTLRDSLSGVGSCPAGQYVSTLNSDAAPTCTADDDTPESGDFGALALSGDVVSSGLVTTIQPNSVALTTDTTGNYVAGATANQGLLLTGTEAGTLGLIDCAALEVLQRNSGDTAWICAAMSGGGGSSNSFQTIDAPSGTDPVADSATDTLDLDAGWGIELIGTAASDKLDIARRNPTSYVEIVEEFTGGTTTAGNVGENGLHGYGTTPTRLAAEAGRPGLYRMSTPATDGAVRGIGFASVNNSSIIDIDDVERAIFIVRPVLNTLVEVRCGFGQDLNNTAYGSDGVYFEFDTGVGLNWTTITRASSTSTTNTTAVAVAANTWYRLEIVRNSSTNYEFYIDGVLVFTHSANKPTIVLNMGCAVEANSAAVRELDYDLYVLTAAVSR